MAVAAIVALLLLGSAAGAAAQDALLLDPVPVGRRPVGVAVTAFSGPFQVLRRFVAVANSGDNSVSVFEFKGDPFNEPVSLVAVTTIPQVPAPFAVASCRISRADVLDSTEVLVTSPTTNSVTLLRVPGGILLRTIPVGPQPHSAACFSDSTGPKAVVSNLGDNSLVVVDLNSFALTARITDVPGSRGLHGIALTTTQRGNLIAWVAGTDAHMVTLVDLTTSRVLTRIPVPAPSAAICCVAVASALDNSITTYRVENLEILSVIRNVPNPQDFVRTFSGLGDVATVGGSNSIARITSDGKLVTVVPGIPGAAGVAASSWSGFRQPTIGVALVTSPDSNRLFVVQQRPLPRDFSMTNAASFGMAAPGSLTSAFLASGATGAGQNYLAGSLPLPTTLGGVKLRLGGRLEFVNSRWVYSGGAAAPLLFVGPRQVNFQMPAGIGPPGVVAAAQLERPDGSTLLSTVSVVAAAPGIFTVLENGQGQASLLNQDNSVNGNAQSILGARPAPRGSVIQIFATGAGATNLPIAPGEAAPASGNPLVLTLEQPAVTIGGQTARVLFSGMAPGLVGVWQINAEVPPNVARGMAVQLSVTAGNISSNLVTIAVQ